MASSKTLSKTDQVDEVPSLLKLIFLGLQHVLVMYAGAVAPPLILAGAMNLPKDQVAFLVNADLFAAGIASIIQAVGFWKFGIRLPIMMGVTFAAVGPMIAIGLNPEMGLLGVYGATIVAGVFGMVVAPFFSRLLPYFPPVVTGTVICVIGMTIMGVGVNWAAGGFGAGDKYGDPLYLAIALFVMAVILLVVKFAKGFLSNVAVLIGLIAGFILAIFLGMVNASGLSEAPWFAIIKPFHYGMPTFHLAAILPMCLVMLITMVESTGMFLAVGEIVKRPVEQKALTRGLLADSLGTSLGGIFNTFPYTSFAQNVGLVGVTGVRSRWVAAMGGLILILLGLIPKMAYIVASIPEFVLGGAGIVMFGMVAATGIRILGRVDYEKHSHNLYIVAISIGAGLIPVVASKFFSKMPHAISGVLESGILLAMITAVALNLYFNGSGSQEKAKRELADTTFGD